MNSVSLFSVALSWRLGGAVAALGWRCRGAGVALSWRCRGAGVALSRRTGAAADLLGGVVAVARFLFAQTWAGRIFLLVLPVAPLSPSLAFT